LFSEDQVKHSFVSSLEEPWKYQSHLWSQKMYIGTV